MNCGCKSFGSVTVDVEKSRAKKSHELAAAQVNPRQAAPCSSPCLRSCLEPPSVRGPPLPPARRALFESHSAAVGATRDAISCLPPPRVIGDADSNALGNSSEATTQSDLRRGATQSRAQRKEQSRGEQRESSTGANSPALGCTLARQTAHSTQLDPPRSHSRTRPPLLLSPHLAQMSVLSHHFQQQRKNDAVLQRTNLKPQQQAAPQKSAAPLVASAPAVASAGSSQDIRSLAAAARKGTIGWDDLSDTEVLLRKWDMQLQFGPSTGMTRMERWERANAMGLNPPSFIRDLLQSMQLAGAEKKPTVKSGSGSHSVFHTTVHGREA